MNKYFLLFTIGGIFKIGAENVDCPIEIIEQCQQQKNCEDCLQLHACCHWSYDLVPGQNPIRCDSKENLVQNSPPDQIEMNCDSSVTFPSNDNFSDVNVNEKIDAIQFMPQIVDLTLRKGEPINVTIAYRPAKNFPLDLYYLMDLTISMRGYLDKFKSLGGEIFDRLEKLTENYRIAFGSYVDKPAMPFYLTDPESFENPCRMLDDPNECEKGYLFKHGINFTNDRDEFLDKLRSSGLSANIDNMEGGFDALMQILRCGETLDWGKSRKFVVLATESWMHLAGDGLLSGSTKRLPKTCQLTNSEQTFSNLQHDYPSLQEVFLQLKRSKTNLIIACNNMSKSYYNEIHKLMPFVSKVGSVEGESTKILDLIEDGYYNFVRQVRLFPNYTGLEGLKVDLFADCLGDGVFNKTSQCFNAQEGRRIEFKAQFLLEDYPKESEGVVTIDEENIQERVTVNLKIAGYKCKCPKLSALAMKSGLGCKNGHHSCGSCKCQKGWTGEECADSCTSNLTKCRFQDENNEIHITCFGNGNCMCGACDCDFGFSGAYCEHVCPHDISTRLICGGHGRCRNGTCDCDRFYTGDDCTCPTATNDCLVPGAETICNNRGTCACNRCNCDHPYAGKYCEICQNCDGFCNIYTWSVEDHMKSEQIVTNHSIMTTRVRIVTVDDLEPESLECVHNFVIGDREDDPLYCNVRYTYRLVNDKHVDVEVSGGCFRGFQASFWGGVGAAVVVLMVFLGLLLWKVAVTRKDKKEYERFLNEQTNTWDRAAGTNPLYKSPIVSYQNPMELSHFNKND